MVIVLAVIALAMLAMLYLGSALVLAALVWEGRRARAAEKKQGTARLFVVRGKRERERAAGECGDRDAGD